MPLPPSEPKQMVSTSKAERQDDPPLSQPDIDADRDGRGRRRKKKKKKAQSRVRSVAEASDEEEEQEVRGFALHTHSWLSIVVLGNVQIFGLIEFFVIFSHELIYLQHEMTVPVYNEFHNLFKLSHCYIFLNLFCSFILNQIAFTQLKGTFKS